MQKLLFALASFALASGDSSASTIQYSTSFPLTPAGFSVRLPIQRFDPSLGVLQSLSLTLSGTVTGYGTVLNNGASAETYTVNLEDRIGLLDPLAHILVTLIPVYSVKIKLAGNGGSGNVAGSGTGAATTTYTTPEALDEFTGQGSLTATVMGTDISSLRNSRNAILSANTSLLGSVLTTYTFAASPHLASAPEPGTVGLLGSALFTGLLCFRRSTPRPF